MHALLHIIMHYFIDIAAPLYALFFKRLLGIELKLSSLLQEGFGLSSSPVLRGRGAVRDVIPFEAGSRMRFVPKQVVRHGPSM